MPDPYECSLKNASKGRARSAHAQSLDFSHTLTFPSRDREEAVFGCPFQQPTGNEQTSRSCVGNSEKTDWGTPENSTGAPESAPV